MREKKGLIKNGCRWFTDQAPDVVMKSTGQESPRSLM